MHLKYAWIVEVISVGAYIITKHGVTNAMILMHKSGVINGDNRVSGSATFERENDNDLKLSVDWVGDSLTYEFENWKLNSSMKGFTVSYYDKKTGYKLHANIEKRERLRYDISVYDTENNLKQLIILT